MRPLGEAFESLQGLGPRQPGAAVAGDDPAAHVDFGKIVSAFGKRAGDAPPEEPKVSPTTAGPDQAMLPPGFFPSGCPPFETLYAPAAPGSAGTGHASIADTSLAQAPPASDTPLRAFVVADDVSKGAEGVGADRRRTSMSSANAPDFSDARTQSFAGAAISAGQAALPGAFAKFRLDENSAHIPVAVDRGAQDESREAEVPKTRDGRSGGRNDAAQAPSVDVEPVGKAGEVASVASVSASRRAPQSQTIDGAAPSSPSHGSSTIRLEEIGLRIPIAIGRALDDIAAPADSGVEIAAPRADAETRHPRQTLKILKFEIEPESLGAISVRMKITQARVEISMEARADVAPALIDAQDRLSAAIGEKGMTLESFDIRIAAPAHAAPSQDSSPGGGGNFERGAHDGRSSQHDRREDRAAAPPREEAPSSLRPDGLIL